jgi:Holliday junction resolvase-like predicted endonuclease
LSNIVKRDVIVMLLSLTKEEPVAVGDLRAAIRVTSEKLELFLNDLVSEGVISRKDDLLEADRRQRLTLAVKAVRYGADFRRVCRALGWLEFEEMVSYVFEENGYKVLRRFRFQAEGRRWEIDVLAMQRPLIVCVECKHWTRGLSETAAKKMVDTHLEKVNVFSEQTIGKDEKLGLRGWNKCVVVPVGMSLIPAPIKQYRQMPIVSILELPGFLNEFNGYLDCMAKFTMELPGIKSSPYQTGLRRG